MIEQYKNHTSELIDALKLLSEKHDDLHPELVEDLNFDLNNMLNLFDELDTAIKQSKELGND
jgi:hypothetical protein